MAESGDVYCRNCGVRLRRIFGHWYHVKHIGPLACPHAEREDVAQRDDDDSDA